MRIGDLVKDQSGYGWTGIIIAMGGTVMAGEVDAGCREVKVHFLTHNVSRWMLAERLEIVNEAR